MLASVKGRETVVASANRMRKTVLASAKGQENSACQRQRAGKGARQRQRSTYKLQIMILRADGVTRKTNYGLAGFVSKSYLDRVKIQQCYIFFELVAPGTQTQNATRGKKKHVLERIVLN